MPAWSRRHFLTLAGGLTASCATGGRPPATEGLSDKPLKVLAARRGIKFGTAMSSAQLADPMYTDLVRRECAVIVAENEHKMYTIQPTPAPLDFSRADGLAAFARDHRLGVRGHTLVWHHPRWLPDWVNDTEFSSASEAARFLTDYIQPVAARHADVVYSWDVVNEAVEARSGTLRETSFSRAMGAENVIDHCFRVAREALPTTTLAYNDYMSWESNSAAHRDGVLRLLEVLKKRGTPIDALGIQSHSNHDMPDEFTPAKQRAWRGFCDEVVGMGLDIYLTEYDVNDTRLTPDIGVRDRLIASYTKDYLDMMFAYPEVKDLLVWGLVDKDSWLQGFLPRGDGVEKRPAPFDSDYRPKRMRTAIAEALAAAPAR